MTKISPIHFVEVQRPSTFETRHISLRSLASAAEPQHVVDRSRTVPVGIDSWENPCRPQKRDHFHFARSPLISFPLTPAAFRTLFAPNERVTAYAIGAVSVKVAVKVIVLLEADAFPYPSQRLSSKILIEPPRIPGVKVVEELPIGSWPLCKPWLP